ncbi:streptogrisin C [Microbacterium sp. AG157]|nr:streptogrisin C [Microbacterium sp. AG157]
MEGHSVNRISKMAVSASALGLIAVSAAAAPALAQPAFAVPSPSSETQLLDAMAEALGTDVAGAQDVLRFQADATALTTTVASVVGDAYAGAWIDESSRTVYAAATSDAARALVASAGATPIPADHSLSELEGLTARISGADRPAGVASWHVDVAANDVVVEALPGSETNVTAFVTALGAPADAVRVETAGGVPQTFDDLRGGIAYFIENQYRCSIGFGVVGGFVTAGHCGSQGESTNYGTFAGSSFPGNDYAWVSTPNHTPLGEVVDWSGGNVAVAGSTPAPVGATVCRSGSTTGWHCGEILAYDTSVQYGSNTVNGLIETTVCAEPGDSGGSLLAGDQAQGVTSGGWGDCSSGGQTWFQPVNEILDAYGLTLLTS